MRGKKRLQIFSNGSTHRTVGTAPGLFRVTRSCRSIGQFVSGKIEISIHVTHFLSASFRIAHSVYAHDTNLISRKVSKPKHDLSSVQTTSQIGMCAVLKR